MTEKIVSLIVFIATLVILWIKTHSPFPLLIFGGVEFLIFLGIWFSNIVAEYVLPFMSIWAPLARDFTTYSRQGYSIAIKIIGWIFIALLFLLTLLIKKQV